MRGKEKNESKQGTPLWMTTFGDSMSLLLTFFVMLFSVTALNETKVRQGLGSLKGALGGIAEGTMKESVVPQEGDQMQKIAKEMEEYIASQGLGEEISVTSSPERITINLKSPILFDLGKDNLKESALPVLDKIASLIKDIPNEINVEGHTDNLPIHTERFPSNWELSAARAISVANYLIQKGISPERIGVIGYADTRPLFPNDTAEHRALNRRVEILILR